MAAFDPPWRLDPLKNIVGVGWGNADILVVRIDITINVHAPREMTFERLKFKDAAIDPFITINEHDAKTPDIVEPISGDMLAHGYMWSKVPWKLHNSDGDHWRAVAFLNLRKIKSTLALDATDYEFEVHFPGSQDIVTSSILYWVWTDNFSTDFFWNKDHPHTTGIVIDDEGHTAVVSVPFIPTPNGTAARDLFFSRNAGALPPFLPFNETVTDRVSDNFSWMLDVASYRAKRKFPVDTQNRPLWDESVAISKKQDRQFAIIGGGPNVTVKVKVKLKTLDITLSRA